MTRLAIKVENLSKEYVLGGEVDQQRTFREMLMGAVKEPINRLKRLQGISKQQERFWALKDINFSVNEGEVFGIIGANGAGKSTLLKVLSRITAPTEGLIQYRGRIASLLEVGTGFHPELTGRENIYINGAILGMTRREVARRFDEIVAFAEIAKFIDTPVKRYSSGMYVRLAFAVAAHLDADVLVVDEVLAVGDTSFQKKCLGTMKNVSRSGRTVIFVSHNLVAIAALTDRVISLREGRLDMEGNPQDVINSYLSSTVEEGHTKLDDFRIMHRSDQLFFKSLELHSGSKHSVTCDKRLRIKATLEAKSLAKNVSLGYSIFYIDGTCIGTSFSKDFSVPAGITDIDFIIPPVSLVPGDYYLGVSVGYGGVKAQRVDFDVIIGRPFFKIKANGRQSAMNHWQPSWGRVCLHEGEINILGTSNNQPILRNSPTSIPEDHS